MQKVAKESREDILVKSFLVCPNISEISRQTGMSRSVIYSIMEKPTFKEKLLKAKQDALQNTVSFLQGSLAECANTLMQIIRDSETSAQTKVNAAQVVMSQTKTWTEAVDVLDRITKLEATIESEKEER